MGGKADITSGGYSNGASGHLIENGQITRPIKEVTIASTLLDMFNTLTPANDLSFKYLVNSPTVRVDFMTVAKSLRRYRQTRGLDALPTHNETEPLVAKTRGNGPISSTRHIRRIVQDCFDRAYERMRADRLEDDVLDLRDNDTVYIYSIVMAAFASGSSSCKYWFFDDSD